MKHLLNKNLIKDHIWYTFIEKHFKEQVSNVYNMGFSSGYDWAGEGINLGVENYTKCFKNKLSKSTKHFLEYVMKCTDLQIGPLI